MSGGGQEDGFVFHGGLDGEGAQQGFNHVAGAVRFLTGREELGDGVQVVSHRDQGKPLMWRKRGPPTA